MGVYFADTFFWIAMAHPRDAWHSRVVAWENSHPGGQFVTTEEVLGEVLNWFAATGHAGRAVAGKLVRSVLTDSSVKVLPQTTDHFANALKLYAARPDKEYSLTDCRSMIALHELGISEVLTNDHHFTQEGFTILFF